MKPGKQTKVNISFRVYELRWSFSSLQVLELYFDDLFIAQLPLKVTLIF